MRDLLELKVTRLIDAPVDTVWRIATQRMSEWWCPRPWTTEIVELDWRPGGRSAMIMHGPEGEEHPQEGVFLEVVPGVRFVFADAYRAGWVPQTPFMTGIFEFAEEDGKTRYTASARHWTEEARARHEAMGFTDGWSAVAGQLAALAEA
ncbi:SRPBCC family protein [uncultured Sphingomonas sp.]|uniref:SRPBCC family protein n=1 Tax=uncultured Sphingomonas sp. TaxID=158754 RepID=UPI0035CA4749